MKLGDTNPDVTAHCNGVIEEMREKTGYDGKVHTVFVAVYVDNRLEFAGADVQMQGEMSRDKAKKQAGLILWRMDPNGQLSGGVE